MTASNLSNGKSSNTLRFILLVVDLILVVMVISFVGAYVFYPNADVGNLGLYNLQALPNFVLYTLIRAVVGVAIGLVLTFAMMKAVGVNSRAELLAKFQMASNSSHMTLVEGFLIGSMFLAAATPLTDLFAYFLNITFRGGAAILIAFVLILIGMWFAGVNSIEEYREWMNRLHNDDYAKFVRALFIGLMFLATMAGR